MSLLVKATFVLFFLLGGQGRSQDSDSTLFASVRKALGLSSSDEIAITERGEDLLHVRVNDDSEYLVRLTEKARKPKVLLSGTRIVPPSSLGHSEIRVVNGIEYQYRVTQLQYLMPFGDSSKRAVVASYYFMNDSAKPLKLLGRRVYASAFLLDDVDELFGVDDEGVFFISSGNQAVCLDALKRAQEE